SADVKLPEGIDSAEIKTEAFTGPQGSRDQDYRASVEDGLARFVTTHELSAHEGLTIVATWPKGNVTRPTRAMQARYLLRDAQPLVFGAVGLGLLLVYYVLAWVCFGLDPPHGVIVPLYEAPDSLSPGAMRYLLRMGYDDRCMGAAILSLAV